MMSIYTLAKYGDDFENWAIAENSRIKEIKYRLKEKEKEMSIKQLIAYKTKLITRANIDWKLEFRRQENLLKK